MTSVGVVSRPFRVQSPQSVEAPEVSMLEVWQLEMDTEAVLPQSAVSVLSSDLGVVKAKYQKQKSASCSMYSS